MIDGRSGDTARVYVVYSSLDGSQAKTKAAVEGIEDARSHIRSAAGGLAACPPRASGPCGEMLAVVAEQMRRLSGAAEHIVTATARARWNFERADATIESGLAP